MARGDADMVLNVRRGRITVSSVPSAPDKQWHPSADRLVESALQAVKPSQLIGVLLTGMGDDGAASMAKLANTGGRTIAESEESCAVYGMPRSLVELGGAGRILHRNDIAKALIQMTRATQAA